MVDVSQPMRVYRNSNKYILSAYLLMAGRVAFAIGLVLLAASVYYGAESNEIINSIKPDAAIIKYAFVFLSIWMFTVLGSVVIALTLRCDNCKAKLCFTPHGYKSKIKRRRFIAFFYPDDIYEKKLICFKCNTGFKL